MRTYIGPIGFNPTSVTRPILSHGLDDGDAVCLVRPEDENLNRRAKETIADVERTLGALEPDITLATERIPHDDFETATLYCRDIILGSSGDRTLVLGGGARDVLLPLTIAGLALLDCISMTLTFSDIDGSVREIDLPNLSAPLVEPTLSTLKIINDEDVTTVPDITELAESSKSTITRHVNRLDDHGAVETSMDGRIKQVQITTTGRLLVTKSLAEN